MMSYFPFILLCLTVISLGIYLVDLLFFAKARKASATEGEALKRPWLAEQARAFFPIFITVLLIRSFVVQLYNVPTGSLEPTVMPGDFILVNQFAYGLHLPVWGYTLLPLSKPKRGDIVVFHWPVNPRVNFVKRLVGLPGDHISYSHHVLTINGKKVPQRYLRTTTDSNSADGPHWQVRVMQENLFGIKHSLYLCGVNSSHCPGAEPIDFRDLVVPKGEYFMMGDNRVDSDDSRDWGFVPEKDLVGRGELVALSWNSTADHWWDKIRWHRMGSLLNHHLFMF